MESIRLQRKLELALLLLRWFSFFVFLMWTLHKMINPEQARALFADYYKIEGLSDSVLFTLASLEMLLILLFVLGIKKTFTYQAVFVLQLLWVLGTYSKFLTPWEPGHLLYFSSLPMLAALYALYMLKDWDRLLTLEGRSSVTSKSTYSEEGKV